MDQSSLELAQMFAGLARRLHQQRLEEKTLLEVVEAARRAVEGAEHAGVLLLRGDGRIDSPASTGDVVRECDDLQARLLEGPCVQAMGEPPVLRVDDMTAERRWPRFAAGAVERGVHSMLACQLAGARDVLGSLNLYATQPHAFDDAATEMAGIFAAHAAIALANAHLQETLEAALSTRQGIGEATGILMERYRVTSQQAFQMLVTASQHLNVKLRIVAEHVARTGADPDTLTVDDVDPAGH